MSTGSGNFHIKALWFKGRKEKGQKIMDLKSQKIKRMESCRDYIEQVLENAGDNKDEEWWEDQEAWEELEKLACNDQDYATTSKALKIEGRETLVIGVYKKDKKALLDQMARLACAMAEDSDTEGIHLIFFVRAMRDRIRLEKYYLQTAREQIRTGARKNGKKKNLPLHATYVLDTEYKKQDVGIKGLKRYEMIRTPSVSGRINIESAEREQGDGGENLHGMVFTADLIQLVEIYSIIGDQLFEENVRFGIHDMLGVDQAICRTLENEPEHFWYKNNGITILSRKPDLNQRRTEVLILDELDQEKKPSFSVINGAQTITAAARYFFDREFQIEESKDPSKKAELEKKLKHSRTAQVLVRVICIPKEEKVPSGNMAKEISVALNQQKPIKIEDIAFTTEFVEKMADYLEEKRDKGYFCLTRRGEEGPKSHQMELIAFARARKACAGDPGEARSKSANELLKFQINETGSNAFAQKDIFADEWIEAEKEQEDQVFRRFYGAVWFADQLAKRYDKIKRQVKKQFKKEEADVLTALGNGKWYFTAALIQLLNGFSRSQDNKGRSVPDYSAFCCSLEEVEGQLFQGIQYFSRIIVLYGSIHKKEYGEIDSNMFKKSDCYKGLMQELEKVCTEQKKQMTENKEEQTPGEQTLVRLLQEFSGLFFNSCPQSTIKAETKPAVKTALPDGPVPEYCVVLGGNQIPAKSIADEMRKTAEYILTQYPKVWDKLGEDESKWITRDKDVARQREGHFRSLSGEIQAGEFTCWIGTHSNTPLKLRQIEDLCRLAEVHKDEIFWYVESGRDPLFRW